MSDTDTASRRPDDTVWEPMPGSQTLFLRMSNIFEVLYEGTRGGGKTDCLLMDYGQHVGLGYGAAWRGILFRQTYKQLSDVIAKTQKWFPLIWPHAKFNQSEHHWTWPDGERLLLRQFAHENDYWNYHGHEYPWVGWEELCNWAMDAGYKRMMSCCRSSTKGMPRKYRATTNPYGPGHNWVKHRFRLPGSRGVVIRDSYDEEGRLEPARLAIHSHINENAILLEADPDYIARLAAAARNEAERKAWLEGSWDIVAGGMFDDVWDPAVHVMHPFIIPLSWRIERSFDWGSSRPFSVGWWAVSDGTDLRLRDGSVMSTVRGDMFRIYEWYGWSGKPNEGSYMLAVEIARGIIEREVQWGISDRVKPGPADSSIFDVQNGVSIARDMAGQVRLSDGKMYRGVWWSRSDKSPGSRKNGWEQMRKMFRAALQPPKGIREHPGIFIFSTCLHFIRTIPVLPRSERDMDDVDTDAEDHIGDETRYMVRYTSNRPSSGKTVGMF